MKTVHIMISGKVQGVFFRATSKQIADKCSVKGWIKNKDGGDVEAMVTGVDSDVIEFIKWCKAGPEKAKVTNVTVTEAELKMFNTFKVIRN